jgi:phage terminase large subunit-like protein
VVAEVNNGGEMVEAILRVVDDNLAYTAVHATRGKVVRAEPVAALYEQSRISREVARNLATHQKKMKAMSKKLWLVLTLAIIVGLGSPTRGLRPTAW